jgi:hypothetical protein
MLQQGLRRLDEQLVQLLSQLRGGEEERRSSLWLQETISPGKVLELLSAPAPKSKLMPPLRLLGAGSFGTVFEAAGNKGVALKYLFENPLREYEMQCLMASKGLAFAAVEVLNSRATLRSPPRVWFSTQGSHFLTAPTLKLLLRAIKDLACILVLERIDGTLADFFCENHSIMTAAIGDALHKLLLAAQKAGVVHNDVKLDNVGFRKQQQQIVFRFVDCGMSFCRECIVGSAQKKDTVLMAGSLRDGFLLLSSLAQLAAELCPHAAPAAWRLAELRGLTGCSSLTELQETAQIRAKEQWQLTQDY